MNDPKYLCDLLSNMEILRSEIKEGIDFGEPEIIETAAFSWLNFKPHRGSKSDNLVIRRWYVRLFVVTKLKSSKKRGYNGKSIETIDTVRMVFSESQEAY